MEMSLLSVTYQNRDTLMEELKPLLDKGENPNHITKYNESPLRVASNNGRFDAIKLLLENGADGSQLGWSNIFHVIAYDTIERLEEVITEGCDLEHRDFWSRTPLLFSILFGDTNKTAMLIEAGVDVTAVGRCGRTPLAYAIQKDNVAMLNWLLEHGFNPEQRDEFCNTALIEASEHGAVKCSKSLIDRGVDIFAENHVQEQAIAVVSNLEIVTVLVKAGSDINDLRKETRAKMMGYNVDEAPVISEEEYFKGRNRVFGISNPERANNPFWLAMVRCGGTAYQAASKFGKNHVINKNGPNWSFDRFGKSITPLPDGRIIEIAGEHEDHYDPDFCIYNDVFVHDGQGDCEIYIYPKDLFPPTDFHTATLVDECIYIIGNLGYGEDRRPSYTQAFRLDINTLKMERVETTGDIPGWINRHKANFDGKSTITISGGKLIIDDNGKEDYIDNEHSYSLCLKSRKWKRQ
ncbi:hypothetical protein NBRC116602_25340 [Hyphomicrobiales bacterium 4NK60-0047b]